MDSTFQPIWKRGLGTFFVTLFLILPSGAAYASCYFFMHDPSKTNTGLWFWYEALRPFSMAGVALAVLLFIVIALRGRTARGFLTVIIAAICIGILLLLLASHMYHSPWA